MKNGIKLLLSVFIVFASMALFSSCGDDIHEHSYYYEGAEVQTHYFLVYKPDKQGDFYKWRWNSIYGRYECFLPLKLTTQLYEEGAITAAVFIYEVQDDGSELETLKTLPFVHTFRDEGNLPFYTETISFDVTYAGDQSTICFYIQTSDPVNFPGALADYEFKVNIVWDPYANAN